MCVCVCFPDRTTQVRFPFALLRQAWFAGLLRLTILVLTVIARQGDAMTPAGLEPAIPGSVGRCLIHWATGPCDISRPINSNIWTASCGSFILSAWVWALLSVCSALAGRSFPQTGSWNSGTEVQALRGDLAGGVLVVAVVAVCTSWGEWGSLVASGVAGAPSPPPPSLP